MLDMTHRFRYLIYLAAFMLVMSVCFVYAEPVPPPHLLFQTAPQHSGFLAPSSDEPAFDPSALRTATAPMVSPALLFQLQGVARGHHGFLHRSRRAEVHTLPANIPSESSILGLDPNTASAESSLR